MKIKLNTIYHTDCLKGMKFIEDHSIDLILCDLPYGTTECKWDNIIPFDKLWDHYKRIIKENGAIVLTASQPFTTKLIQSNIRWFRYEWIWKKGEHTTGFQNANRMPLKNHENICVFYKKLPTYNPQGIIHIKPKIVKNRTVPKILGENKTSLKNKYVVRKTNYPKSVLNFPRESRTFHPTQKPTELFEYIIKTYTNEGETVLDNCMGSFTTAVAADNTNRNWIGFELDEHYCELGLKRINENRCRLGKEPVKIETVSKVGN